MTRIRYLAAAAVLLASCGEDVEELAVARCAREALQAVASTSGAARAEPGDPGLRDDPVYGWHVDIDLAVAAAGAERRVAYRCLFLVEDRDIPLFLAVVER